jgi:uncharacterized RDD family membrane protein YckC
MQSIKIQTPQNIELEYPLAGVGDRLVAYIIDLLIYMAYIIVIALISDAAGGFSGRDWVIILLMIPIFIYQFLCEVFLNGQSLGKKAKRIRVVSLDGNQPNIGQYLIRWLFRIVDDMIGSGVIAIVTISLTEKAQRVGDVLAGTTVVRTQPQTSFGETLFAETDQQEIVLYPQVSRLSDQDIALLREVLNRHLEDPNVHGAILQKAADKIQLMLLPNASGIPNSNPSAFLEKVIRDYNSVTGKEA